MLLYHYTCRHRAAFIRRERMLKGNPHPWLLDVGPLIHLTDLDQPDRLALGLTSNILTCDRTEFRVTVETDVAERWSVFARTIPRRVREGLETAPGALPAHWWVARMPLPIVDVDDVAAVV